MAQKLKKKFYAVKKGKMYPVVVQTWKECQDLTEGVPDAKYKGFMTEEEAWDWIYGINLNAEVQFGKNEDSELDTIYIYSDGACSGNPGPGGWASIVKFNGQVKELSGYEEDTSNNRMELQGFLSGLKFALTNYGKDKKIVITLDSQYVLNGASNWIFNWQKNNWKRPKNEEIVNVDLWKEIYNLIYDVKNIKWKWIKGHNGHPENERCDQLAVYAYQSKADDVYIVNEKGKGVSYFTNFSLIRSVDKETLVKLLCSNKFQKLICTEGPTKLLEILDKPAEDWGVDDISQMLKVK